MPGPRDGFTPPFCPNPDCAHSSPDPWRFKKKGFHERQAPPAASSGTGVNIATGTSVHRPSPPPTGSKAPAPAAALLPDPGLLLPETDRPRVRRRSHSTLVRLVARLGRHCLLLHERLRPPPPRGSRRPRRLPLLRVRPILALRPQPPGGRLSLRLRLQRGGAAALGHHARPSDAASGRLSRAPTGDRTRRPRAGPSRSWWAGWFPRPRASSCTRTGTAPIPGLCGGFRAVTSGTGRHPRRRGERRAILCFR